MSSSLISSSTCSPSISPSSPYPIAHPSQDDSFSFELDPDFDFDLSAHEAGKSPQNLRLSPNASTVSSFDISATTASASRPSGLTAYALQLRTDNDLVKRVRQDNTQSFRKLQEQNAVLTTLRKTIVAQLKMSHCQSYRRHRLPSRSGQLQAKSSSRMSDLRGGDNLFSTRQKRGSCRYDDDHHSLNGHRLLHIYVDAIDNIQKSYRRLRWTKLRDDLIKRSTLPVVTFRSDKTTPGMGLVGFSGRLLHASYLEDLILRCLAKQQCLLTEAQATLPPPGGSLTLFKTTPISN